MDSCQQNTVNEPGDPSRLVPNDRHFGSHPTDSDSTVIRGQTDTVVGQIESPPVEMAGEDITIEFTETSKIGPTVGTELLYCVRTEDDLTRVGSRCALGPDFGFGPLYAFAGE